MTSIKHIISGLGNAINVSAALNNNHWLRVTVSDQIVHHGGCSVKAEEQIDFAEPWLRVLAYGPSIYYSGPVITRKAARLKKLDRYFTGQSCINYHIDQRYLNKNCVQCSVERLDKWRQGNKEIYHTHAKNWQKKNPKKLKEIRNHSTRVRRASKKSAEGSHTKKDIERIKREQNNKCANTSCRKSIKEKYHVDHIAPLCKGGSNWAKNLQILCPVCNLKKHAKHPLDWARENGLLV